MTTPMAAPERQRPWAAIVAATALNLPLGSVYAFSVFLRPIEQELQVPRSALSVVFGMATVGFTIGSLIAPFCYRLASPAILTLLCALSCTIGIALAATAHSLPMLLLGYGIVFGIGGGAGYILLQQGVNLLVRSRKGLVNGYLISLYPAGAVISAPIIPSAIAAVSGRGHKVRMVAPVSAKVCAPAATKGIGTRSTRNPPLTRAHAMAAAMAVVVATAVAALPP